MTVGKNKAKRIWETDIGAAVVAHLSGLGWEVYQEVQVFRGGSVADVVGRMGQLLWVVECKTSCSLALLGQAQKWASFAHYVSVAVPVRNRPGAQRIKHPESLWWFLRQAGIGMLGIEPGVHEGTLYVVGESEPKLRRRVRSHYLHDALCDEQQVAAGAGSANGGHVTEFRRTAMVAVRFVGEHPGCTLKEVVDGIEHHYASGAGAQAGLVAAIRGGWIKGIRMGAERPRKMWPEETENGDNR